MEKINIAIIDSNLIQRNETCTMVEEYIRGRPLRVEVTEFDSGTALIREISRRGQYDIYIIEVMMPDMNGIHLARELRSSGDRGEIIYLSKNQSDAYYAFQVKASGFVLKPLMKERLSQVLDEIFSELIKTQIYPVVDIKFKTGLMRVPMNSITYVDIVDRALCFHMENGACFKTSCVRGSFREELGSISGHLLDVASFVFAGRAHLLNISYIMTLGKGMVLLKTGEQVYIPRSAEEGLQRAWEQFKF